MITEQELKEQCTPDFIKWMCEHAEGFEYYTDDYAIYNNTYDTDEDIFPLLIHRAVEGWNKKDRSKNQINILTTCVQSWNIIKGLQDYIFNDYESNNLTQSECAMLHCLLDVFKTGGER